MGSQFLHVNEPGFDQVVELLTCYRGDLSEIRQALRTLTDKVDSLMKESTAHDQPVSNPMTLGDGSISFQRETLFEELNSIGVFPYPLETFSHFDTSYLTPHHSYPLPPRTAPASMVYRDGVWADPEPPISWVQTNPMPPENDSWCYGGDSGSGDDYVGDGSFPGGGHNGHQSTELWADVSAEASTSLAPAKPIIIENSDQSESSTPATSSSHGGCNRARNDYERKCLLESIRGVLQIPWERDEVATLRATIQELGTTVPEVPEPTAGHRISQVRKRNARSTYYHELKRLVGPQNGKLVKVETLHRALQSLTNQGSNPQGSKGEREGYSVFRLQQTA